MCDTSLSVGQILLPRYMSWSSNFRALPLNENRAPSGLKHINTSLQDQCFLQFAPNNPAEIWFKQVYLIEIVDYLCNQHLKCSQIRWVDSFFWFFWLSSKLSIFYGNSDLPKQRECSANILNFILEINFHLKKQEKALSQICYVCRIMHLRDPVFFEKLLFENY